MKASKLHVILGCLLISAFFIEGVSDMAVSNYLNAPNDIELRYNESCCAHDGINPFHIWSGAVVNDHYKGIRRYDKPYDQSETKRRVHAYTPWHMAMTWFYGWMDFPFLLALVFAASGFCLAVLGYRLRGAVVNGNIFLSCALWFMLFPALIGLYLSGNYGLILAGLLLLLMYCVKRDWQIAAGVLWAVMLVKPQVSALFFFSLLFQRKYKAIVIACVICGLLTLWPAYVFHESPIDLVRQVLDMTKPYETNVIFRTVLPVSVAPFAKMSWTLLCVMGCAWLCWRARDGKDVVVRYAAPAFFFPVWMYGQVYDRVVQWPFLSLLIPMTVLALRGDYGKRGKCLAFCFVLGMTVVSAFRGCWNLAFAFGVTHGFGLFYNAVDFPLSCLVVLIEFIALLAMANVFFTASVHRRVLLGSRSSGSS